MKKRIVCWFSCGAASAVATKLAIVENADLKNQIVVVRCIVREEHQDNDRFAKDCEKWFGIPIINLINEKYDGSILEVFKRRGYISGIGGAPCTRLLKKEIREKYSTAKDNHVFGYTANEVDRWNRFLDANNISASTPLIEHSLQHSDCLAMIKRAGIELPAMYKLGYKHNNCIGCVKASGAGYWNKIRKDFPEQFLRIATVSRQIGCRLTRENSKRIFLDELPIGTGCYSDEPEVQCGVFCELAEQDIAA